MNRIFGIACLLILLQCAPVQARLNLNDRPPKALLVQLLTRKSQTDYLRKHNPAKLAEFLKDVKEVMKMTTKDFADNYQYGPVFFFVDTCGDSIKNGHFEGYLLDNNLKPVHQTVLPEGDTSFFIAYYGSYVPQPMNLKSTDDEKPGDKPQYIVADDDPTALKPTLLVLDHKYRLLKVPRPRTTRGFVGVFNNGRYRDYVYRSKSFSVDYLPMAATYSNTIRKYYARIARRNALSYQ